MFNNEIEELVHLYEDGAFPRRELLRRIAKVTGSLTTAAAAVAALGVPEEASAQTAAGCEDLRVSATDREVQSVIAEFPGEAGKLFGYLSLPTRTYTGPMPAVLVIHENRGLTEHIKDVTRRVAKAGYAALGIDLISRWGGTDQYPDPAAAAAAYSNVTSATALADARSALEYLKTLGVVNSQRLGSIGFCAGGGHCWNLAVNQPDLTATVVYYGTPASAASIATVQSKLLLHYAELDRNFTGQVPAALTALVNLRKTFELHVWEGASHAFNNDTGANFNPGVACDAWAKTLQFFARHLLRA